tara:strand:+ start:1868 stop:2320 length:453 start_codon:yes stop_codon:yes gene_type:complete
METKKEIIVIDWLDNNTSKKAKYLNLTLSSEQRNILRGKRLSDCNQELFIQLPRRGKISDGDILLTNISYLCIKVIAKREKLIQIKANSNLELLKTTYHLGNRHVKMEIKDNFLFVPDDYLIETLLKNLKVEIFKVNKKFFPEVGPFEHG